MDTTRQDLERREEETLAPYALRSARARRARPLDPEGRLFDYRTEYQRDRDRILHARAFRRLRLKAEGGAAGAADQRRDYLTRTLETTQVARTIARALALNEDLAEAIALAAALGTPPFGRDGARALDDILRAGGRPLPGGFDVRLQSLRVVDLLEKRYEHTGLNLTHDVREGILKQEAGAPVRQGAPPRKAAPRRAAPERPPARPGSALGGIDLGALDPGSPPSLEAQAVSAAGRIAAVVGDLDDALRAGEAEPAEVERLPIVRELIRRLGERYPAASRGRLAAKVNLLHRGLTHLLVTGTIQHARRTLGAWRRQESVTDHDAFLAARRRLPPRAIEPAPRTRGLFESLREHLDRRLGATAAATLAASRARQVLAALLEAYHRDPRLLDDYVLLRFKEAAGGTYLRDFPAAAMESEISRRYHGSGVFLRLVGDHIAGMTDAYALSEHDRLSGASPPAGGRAPLP